jgi:uncharacterized membrane protein YqjE
MQFFLVSPIFVYPLYRWEMLGMGLLALASIASIATPWIIHLNKNPPSRSQGSKLSQY